MNIAQIIFFIFCLYIIAYIIKVFIDMKLSDTKWILINSNQVTMIVAYIDNYYGISAPKTCNPLESNIFNSTKTFKYASADIQVKEYRREMPRTFDEITYQTFELIKINTDENEIYLNRPLLALNQLRYAEDENGTPYAVVLTPYKTLKIVKQTFENISEVVEKESNYRSQIYKLKQKISNIENKNKFLEEKNKPRLIDEVICIKNCAVNYAAKTKARQTVQEKDLKPPKNADISLVYPKGVYYDGEKTIKHRYNKPKYYITKLSFSAKNYLTFDQSQADENVIVKNQLKLDEITEVTDKHGKNYFILLTSEELDKKAAEVYGYKSQL